MRRQLGPLIGAVAVLAILSTAVSVTWAMQRSPQMMGYQPGWTTPDRARPWGGMGMGWMHGSAVSNERDFLVAMTAHHEEAVSAARHLHRSSRPRMRALGASIVKTQSAQIEQMDRWIRTWYPTRSGDVDYEPMMRDLSGLSGDALDIAFLEDMIGHHMAAVMMSQHLLVRGLTQHAQVEQLAEAIRDEQHAEIFQMRSWLTAWFDQGRSERRGHRYPPGWHMGPGTTGVR